MFGLDMSDCCSSISPDGRYGCTLFRNHYAIPDGRASCFHPSSGTSWCGWCGDWSCEPHKVEGQHLNKEELKLAQIDAEKLEQELYPD